MATFRGTSGTWQQLSTILKCQGFPEITSFRQLKFIAENFSAYLRKAIEANPKRPDLAKKRAMFLKHVLDQHQSTYLGMKGETLVIEELRGLPDPYHVFNELHLALNKSVLWNKYKEHVRTCKIDHAIIGRTGIFLVETKYWAENSWSTFYPPHRQIERAGYIFYTLASSQFNDSMSVKDIIVTIGSTEKRKYGFTNQFHYKNLVDYILHREKTLRNDEVRTISNWLEKVRIKH